MTFTKTEAFTLVSKAAAIDDIGSNNGNNSSSDRSIYIFQKNLQLSMTLAVTMATTAAATEAFKLVSTTAAINDIGSDNGNNSSTDRGIYIGSKSCS